MKNRDKRCMQVVRIKMSRWFQIERKAVGRMAGCFQNGKEKEKVPTKIQGSYKL